MQFSILCPHCHHSNTAFTVVHSVPRVNQPRGAPVVEITVFAVCNSCYHGVVCDAYVDTSREGARPDIQVLQGNLSHCPWLVIGEWLPRPPTPDVPEHLPPAVHTALLQAERARHLADNTAPAAMCYRRALQIGVRALQAQGNNLLQEIDSLVTNGRLTNEMGSWAHEVRLIGNDGAHEEAQPTNDEIESIAEFTRLFMLYAFTLPAMLAAHRNRARQP